MKMTDANTIAEKFFMISVVDLKNCGVLGVDKKAN
jgi:hypothetical protein